MNLSLVTKGGDMATTGVLTVDSASFFSIEQPWRDNKKGESCVPAGTYQLIPYVSPKHGDTWCLHNPLLGIYSVDAPPGGRDYCEIHSANWAEQLEGCIALGLEAQPMYDPLTGKVEPAVEHSKDAIEHLIAMLGAGTHGHTLTIVRQ